MVARGVVSIATIILISAVFLVAAHESDGSHHSSCRHHHHHHEHGHDHHHHDHGRALLPEEIAEEEDFRLLQMQHEQEHDHEELSVLELWMHAMASSFLVSTASLVCLTLIAVTGGKKISPTLVDALAAFGGGAMMGDAFLHQLPHAFGRQAHSHSHDSHEHLHNESPSHSHSLEDIYIGLSILGGIVLFFLIEKLVRYVEQQGFGHGHHHHHSHKHEKIDDQTDVNDKKKKTNGKPSDDSETDVVTVNKNKKKKKASKTPDSSIPVLGLLNLFTDGVHNLTDGIALGAAFLAYGKKGGWYRAWFLLCHEIPQEVGDFGILVRSGFSVFKALAFNFLSALLAVAGAALVLIIGADFGNSSLIEGFTAGGFLYISMAGVLPEMHQQGTSLKTSIVQLAALSLGIGAAVIISLNE